MGEEHSQYQRNHGEISPGNVRRGGTLDPIGVDILTTHHKEYGRRIHRSGGYSLGRLFSSPFLRKFKISHTPNRNSKYDTREEIWPGPPESSDVRKRKISKFEICKHGVDLIRDREN